MTLCPYKVGQQIEGKEIVNSLLGLLSSEVWHQATVEKTQDDLMLISCPEMFGEKKVWLEYQADWFREVKETI